MFIKCHYGRRSPTLTRHRFFARIYTKSRRQVIRGVGPDEWFALITLVRTSVCLSRVSQIADRASVGHRWRDCRYHCRYQVRYGQTLVHQRDNGSNTSNFEGSYFISALRLPLRISTNIVQIVYIFVILITVSFGYCFLTHP